MVEDLDDFLSIPGDILVFKKAPVRKVVVVAAGHPSIQAKAARTIQRHTCGFITRALCPALTTVQRQAYQIAAFVSLIQSSQERGCWGARAAALQIQQSVSAYSARTSKKPNTPSIQGRSWDQSQHMHLQEKLGSHSRARILQRSWNHYLRARANYAGEGLSFFFAKHGCCP